MTPVAPPHATARFPMNTTATLLSLVAGLAVGLLAGLAGNDRFTALAEAAGAIGGLWTAALRIIVIPLVVCLLITGLAGAGTKLVGRLGATTLCVYVVILLAGAAMTIAATPALIRGLRVEARALSGTGPPSAAPTRTDGTPPREGAAAYFEGVGQAVARNQLLQVIAISIVFALAMTQVDAARRRRLLDFFSDALSVVLVALGWLLRVLPAAAFALSFAAAAQRGVAAAHALGAFVLMSIGLIAAGCVALYPAAVLFGRVSLRRFAWAALPAQAAAAGTRSSLASLPALLESGRRLGLPEDLNAFVMPLSVSIFKANRTISGMLKMLFLAHVYGVEVGPAGILAYAGVLALLSFATPGTPGGGAQSSTVPLLAMGIPLEGIVLAQAVDDIPDVFKTITNVTADLAAGAIVYRFAGEFRPVASTGAAPIPVET